MSDDEKAISKVGEERWAKFKQLQEKRLQLANPVNDKKRKSSTPTIHQPQSMPEKKSKKEKLVSASNTPLEVFLKMDDDDRRFDNNSKVSLLRTNAVGLIEQSELEMAFEKAISEGNLVEAEELNEKLVQQQAEQKLVKAIERKQYVVQKEQKEQKKQSRKQKINWR